MKHLSVRLCAAFAAAALLLPFAAVPAQAAEPYEVNAILSLTGNLAFLGKSEALAIKTLEPIINKNGGINGRPVHFVIVDDTSQPAVAVQLAGAIIAKHAPVILGPTYSASCLAIGPLLRANGPVDYCFAPTIHPPPGSYQFSGGASSQQQAVASLNFALAKGWKRLAAIATTDSTGQDIEDTFKIIGTGKYAGMSLVANEHFNPSDVSVAAQMANIKTSKPDAILAMSIGPASGTAFRGLRDAGLDRLPIISNLGNLLTGELKRFAPIMPQETYFTAPRFYAHDVSGKGPVRDAQLAFLNAFSPLGIKPDVGNNFAWDPTLIVISGLRKLGTQTTAKALLDYIENLHGFAGTNGIYDFRDGGQRGQGLNTIVIEQWNPAKQDVYTVSEPGGNPLAKRARPQK
jgi:branched-chain amino acid transport system substrate-binding protein